MEDIHQQIHEEFINSEEYDKYLYDIYNYEPQRADIENSKTNI